MFARFGFGLFATVLTGFDRCPAVCLDLRVTGRCLEALDQLACLDLMAIDRRLGYQYEMEFDQKGMTPTNHYLASPDREATGHCPEYPVLVATGHCLVCLVPQGIDRYPAVCLDLRAIDRYLACWLLASQTQFQCQSLWVNQ